MNQYITIFIGVAVLIGVGTLAISISYDSVTLPGGVTVTPGTTEVPPDPNAISNMILWLDADDGSTISIGVGVSQWDDKSGQGNHVTQATGTLQPTVVTSVINGSDAIRFDGVDDYLRDTAFSGGIPSQPITTYLVVSPDVDRSVPHQFYDVATLGNRNTVVQATGGAYVINAGGTSQTSVALAATTFVLLEAYFDGVSTTLKENEVTVISANSGTQGMDGITIAARHDDGNPAAIDIAEFMIFEKALTADEHNDIIDYVEVKYGLGFNITGNYTTTPPIITEGATGWNDVQTGLDTQAQASIGLLVVTLIVLAAVVVIFVARRMS